MLWHLQNGERAVNALNRTLASAKPPKGAKAAGLFASLLTALLEIAQLFAELRVALSSDPEPDDEEDTPQDQRPPRV